MHAPATAATRWPAPARSRDDEPARPRRWPARRQRNIGDLDDGRGALRKAKADDELVVKGHHVGDKDRRGAVNEVRGEVGGPPYLVRWDDGHESTFFPSSDTVAEHVALPTRR